MDFGDWRHPIKPVQNTGNRCIPDICTKSAASLQIPAVRGQVLFAAILEVLLTNVELLRIGNLHAIASGSLGGV